MGVHTAAATSIATRTGLVALEAIHAGAKTYTRSVTNRDLTAKETATNHVTAMTIVTTGARIALPASIAIQTGAKKIRRRTARGATLVILGST